MSISNTAPGGTACTVHFPKGMVVGMISLVGEAADHGCELGAALNNV
jgi:hypothetical protein